MCRSPPTILGCRSLAVKSALVLAIPITPSPPLTPSTTATGIRSSPRATAPLGRCNLYMDGVLQATGTGPSATRATPVSLNIGNIQSGLDFLAGSIDEVRLYNYVVSPATVTQLIHLAPRWWRYYPLDGNAQDTSGFGNLGMINNNVTFVTGKVGTQAAQFDGMSSDIEIPAAVASDFSLAYWMKTTATGGTGQWWSGLGLVDADAPGTAADFGTSLLGPSRALLVWAIQTPPIIPPPTSTTAIGITSPPPASMRPASMKLYVDGYLQATITGPTNTRSAPSGIRLGGIQSGGGFFSGALDDVRLYNYSIECEPGFNALFTPQPLPGPWMNSWTWVLPRRRVIPIMPLHTGTWRLAVAARISGERGSISIRLHQFLRLGLLRPGWPAARSSATAPPTRTPRPASCFAIRPPPTRRLSPWCMIKPKEYNSFTATPPARSPASRG